MNGATALNQAKKYVDEILKGAGALQGLPGKDGVSPTVSVANITGGHKITITDKTGEQSFDVMDGNADIANGTIGMFTLSKDVNIQKDSVLNVSKTQIVGHTPIKYPGQTYDIYVAIIWQGKEIYFSSFIIQKETGDLNQYYEIKLMENPKRLTGEDGSGGTSDVADGFMVFGKLDGVPSIDEEMNLPSSYFIGQKPVVDTIVAKHGIIKVADKVYFIRYKVLETDDSVSKIKYVEEPILLNNETSSNELVTITDTEVTNISQLPDDPCCIHAIRSTIGFQFVDDIIYVQKDDDVVRVYTIDGSILTINVNSTGVLSVSGDSLDHFVKESDLKSTYYNRSQVDEKIVGIQGGADGITPHIGENGNWYIGYEDTGVKAAGSDGATPHIGENGNWYVGEIDTGVHAQGEKGDDGLTPTINPTNKHWMIGEEDTGVVAEGKDGRSIQSITKDENDNIIVTFSDGTTQNIGKLSVDISADFLTENGFGNIRYYNGKFQAYKNDAWVDIAPTPDNTIVVNMMPNPMQRIIGIYDHEVGKNKLKWLEPEDTVVDGQIICVVDKVIIRRKLGSAPTNENDGDLVIEVSKKDFNSHNTNWYFDEGVTPALGDIYYYKAFTYSTTGFVNAASVNETEIRAKDFYLYGYIIDQNESDPDSMVKYIEDNKGFSKAFMDYTADRFNYGDWQDAFIMPRPCMLNTNGTVAYYLDPDDYTKKADGTDSDVSNVDFDGNAMNEWGKIFWKVTDNGDGTGTFLFSDKKVDADFVYWSNMDENGNEIPYFYTPLYDGALINGKLRSLSGQTPMSGKTRQQELDYAHANNQDGVHMYETDVFCDIQLFRMLCVLISRSTNSKKAFGTGNSNSYVSTSNTGIKKTGTMDKKGMFWGDKTNKVGVKIFGREHPTGNIWKACGGWMNIKGTQKIKMTYGQSDGSTVDGYNITGDGYITVEDVTPSGTSGGYISLCKFTENGIIPKQVSGSSTTKYCDGLWFNNGQVDYAIVFGSSGDGTHVGAFCSDLDYAASNADWNVGAGLSCKPPLAIQTGGAA